MKTIVLILIIVFGNISISVGQLNNILHELNIEKDSVVFEFVNSKKLLQSKKIYVIPVLVENVKDSYWVADLYLVKFDTTTNQIVSKSRFKNMLTSDAVSIKKLWIDSTPYFLQENVKSFGIRIFSANNSSVDYGEFEEIYIFEEVNNSFNNLLKLATRQFISDRSTDCENTQEQLKTSFLIIDKHKVNNHFNIIESVTTEEYGLNNNCEIGKKHIRKYKNLFQFKNGIYRNNQRNR